MGTGKYGLDWVEEMKRYGTSIKNYGNTPAIINTIHLIWSTNEINKEILFSKNNFSGYYKVPLVYFKSGICYPDKDEGMNFQLEQKKDGYFGLYVSYNYFINNTGSYGIVYVYDKEKNLLRKTVEWIE